MIFRPSVIKAELHHRVPGPGRPVCDVIWQKMRPGKILVITPRPEPGDLDCRSRGRGTGQYLEALRLRLAAAGGRV